jgi:tripartite-type tricarboxylate transporter receptor subunit TctC
MDMVVYFRRTRCLSLRLDETCRPPRSETVSQNNNKMKSVIAAAVIALVCTSACMAQSYPTKPVRFISPYAPGGGTDTMARTLAQKLSENLGRQVFVENRPGGGGIVGTEITAKSQPDGYTILLGSKGPLTVNPALYAKLPYDTLRDLAPISLVSIVPALLAVHPSLPVKSVKELIALARARPGELTFSSSGNGGSGHLSGEQFAALAGAKMVHVPYRGTGPATTALLSGEVTLSFGNMVALMPHVHAGRLRALGITSAKRVSAAPELQTVAEAGLRGYEYVTWYGVLAPAGTPKDIIGRLNTELVKIARLPDMKEKLTGEGGDVVGSTPEEFSEYIKSELASSARLVKSANVRPD